MTAGGKLVFNRVTGGQTDVYSINSDGSGLVALAATVADEDFGGTISGERIVIRRDVGGQIDLFRVDAAGGRGNTNCH